MSWLPVKTAILEAVLTSAHNLFLSRNKKNNMYPCKPQFYYIKVGFKGVKIIKACFRYVVRLQRLICATVAPIWVERFKL